MDKMGAFRKLSPSRTRIMGIVNVNDDSFSGDGSLNSDSIAEIVLSQISSGADLIDLGAESARTNREAISVEEEIARLLPVLERWPELIAQSQPMDPDQQWPPLLSINTWRPEVIRGLLESEFSDTIDLINDMSALQFPETLAAIKGSETALLVMHSVGLPKEDHSDQRWEDIMSELHRFFQESLEVLTDFPNELLVLDPGLDFAKTSSDSLEILQKVSELNQYGCWVLFPLSRKDFIGAATGETRPQERDAGTVACLPYLQGVKKCIVRVHNVKAAYQALRVLNSIRS